MEKLQVPFILCYRDDETGEKMRQQIEWPLDMPAPSKDEHVEVYQNEAPVLMRITRIVYVPQASEPYVEIHLL